MREMARTQPRATNQGQVLQAFTGQRRTGRSHHDELAGQGEASRWRQCLTKARSLEGPQLLRSPEQSERKAHKRLWYWARPVRTVPVVETRFHQGSWEPCRVLVSNDPGVPGVSSGHLCLGQSRNGGQAPNPLTEVMPRCVLS